MPADSHQPSNRPTRDRLKCRFDLRMLPLWTVPLFSSCISLFHRRKCKTIFCICHRWLSLFKGLVRVCASVRFCTSECELGPILVLTGSVGKSKSVAVHVCLMQRLTALMASCHVCSSKFPVWSLQTASCHPAGSKFKPSNLLLSIVMSGSVPSIPAMLLASARIPHKGLKEQQWHFTFSLYLVIAWLWCEAVLLRAIPKY